MNFVFMFSNSLMAPDPRAVCVCVCVHACVCVCDAILLCQQLHMEHCLDSMKTQIMEDTVSVHIHSG